MKESGIKMVQAKQVQRVHVQNDAAMHCLFGGDVRIKHSAFTALISKFRQWDIDRTFNAGSTQTWRKQPENACFLQSFARFQRSLLSHLFRFWTLYFLMTILWLLSKLAAPHHQWHFSACKTSGLQALTFNVQRSTSTATSTLNTRQSTEASLGGFFGTIRRHPELVKSSKTSSKTMYLPISSESVSQYGSSKLHLNLLVICLWYWLTASSPTSG